MDEPADIEPRDELGPLEEGIAAGLAQLRAEAAAALATVERAAAKATERIERAGALASAEARGAKAWIELRSYQLRTDAALERLEARAREVSAERIEANTEDRIEALMARIGELTEALGRTAGWDERLRQASRREEEAAARIAAAERRLRDLIEGR
jgi:hypothetical protein